MGNAMNVTMKLRNIFNDIFDDDTLKISESTSKADIEDWDSVAQIKLVLAIEEEFAIRLTTDEVASVKSVGDFISAIQRHINK